MAPLSNHCSHISEVRDGTSWSQDNPMTYYNGHWLSTSVAESFVASERLRQYEALGHHESSPCLKEYAPKPFRVHSNKLVNHQYYYNWSIVWWICRKMGQPVPEAVLLEI